MLIRTQLDFEDNYSQIPNAWLRDERLTLKAKGLLAQILTHSPGWSMTILSLAKANGCGRDAIRSAIRELCEAGYLERSETRERDAQGRLGDYTYTTCSPKPYVGKPDTGKEQKPRKVRRVSYAGKTYVGKPDTKNINTSISPKEEHVSNKAPLRAHRLKHDWQPSEELIEWATNMRPDLNIQNTLDEFRDYWIAVPGAKALKLDWNATWRNWIRRTHTKTDTPKSNTQKNLELHARLFNTDTTQKDTTNANTKSLER